MPSISPVMQSTGTATTPSFSGGAIPGVTSNTGVPFPGAPSGVPGLGSTLPVQPGQPGAPIMRPSFLQAFIASLPAALAGGMSEAAKNPRAIGAALGGSIQGIQQQGQQNFQNALEGAASQRADVLAQNQLATGASQRAYTTAETNRLNTLTPLEQREKQLGVDAMEAQIQFYANPNNLQSAAQTAARSLGTLTGDEQAQIDAAVKEGQLSKSFAPVANAVKTISQDRLTRGMSSDFLTAAAAKGDKNAQAILDYRNQQAVQQAGATAAAQAKARLPYEVALKNQEMAQNPVLAVNPKTKQRELMTAGDAKAQGYTNQVKVTQGDLEKETQLNSQVNDMQLNTSRYKMSINNVRGNWTGTDVAAATHILSDPNVNGALLANVGFPAVMSMVEQGSVARDWNSLPPDKQQALIDYLRVKNTALLTQKVLTGMGRASKEALDIELKNIPSPIEGATVANRKLDGWQQNIDQIASRTVKLPWMENPQDVRARIEGSAQPQAQQPAKASSGPRSVEELLDLIVRAGGKP